MPPLLNISLLFRLAVALFFVRHVYAIASIAYETMVAIGKDQVCIILGESGAGKTEAAKSFIKQLVNVSKGAEFEGLKDKLISVSPVLEAFGNAKTKFNNNSSRFGKYTSVEFNGQGQVKGAKMTEFLLEKSRVIHQGTYVRQQAAHALLSFFFSLYLFFLPLLFFVGNLQL